MIENSERYSVHRLQYSIFSGVDTIPRGVRLTGNGNSQVPTFWVDRMAYISTIQATSYRAYYPRLLCLILLGIGENGIRVWLTRPKGKSDNHRK